MSSEQQRGKIGVIGSGLIGRQWALMFASVGYTVQMYDILPEQIASALQFIATESHDLEKRGILRGPRTAAEQVALISGTNDLGTLVSGALYVQECVPEVLAIKHKLYAQLDALVSDPETILASSTSTFLPSVISKDMKNRRSQMIVAHPVNPPYHVPLVEIVSASWTRPEFVERTRSLMTEIGQRPVTLRREIEGFALNRIQYAILNETWRLVADGVLDARDVDTVMSEGLGMRYAFLGALETAHLNAEGMGSYCQRYGAAIQAVSQTMGPAPAMHETGEDNRRIVEQLNEICPIEQLPERRAWRDRALQRLAQLKRELQ